MPFTFFNLKEKVRPLVWPGGEARSRRVAHEKWFTDAMLKIQRYVSCWQHNHTNLIRHCNTLFNCGLSSFELVGDNGDPVRGKINRLGVIDKINPDTGLEDATSPDDYCSDIEYQQVDYCRIRDYLGKSANRGCCTPLHTFFDLPFSCLSGKGKIPVPTDEVVLETLPDLPLGYHYPQTSTDYTRRALAGVWAQERGRFYVAPWIQSTETIILRWDGIKRVWGDGDPIDNSPTEDPGHTEAVYYYVLSMHERFDNRDAQQAALAQDSFNTALSDLWKDCKDETMIRGCETSHARAALA